MEIIDCLKSYIYQYDQKIINESDFWKKVASLALTYNDTINCQKSSEKK